MELDIALSHYPSSDLQLIEGAARARRRPSHVPWVGFLVHVAKGAGPGFIYALVQRWLPGPAWLRGILFSEGFILLVWPTARCLIASIR